MTFEERKSAIEHLCMGGSVAFRLDSEGNIVFWEGNMAKPTEEAIQAAYSEFGAIFLEIIAKEKLEELANARFLQETGGLTLPDGTEIRTDRESQALLTGAAFAATMDSETLIEWKGSNGWVVLTPQQVLQIAALVRQHVQAAFSKERELSDRVRASSTQEELGKVTW